MAKNIKINNVTYNSVDSISIPLAGGGGNAAFPDTSDADAAAGDIAAGKTAYVGGLKVTGTATGGVSTLCSVTIQKSNPYGFVALYYVDANGNSQQKIASDTPQVFSVPANTLIGVRLSPMNRVLSGSRTSLYSAVASGYMLSFEYLTGDAKYSAAGIAP